MTDTQVIHLALAAMIITIKLAAPILVTSLVVGFAISLVQSVTQIQEMTLTFVPKALAVGLAILISGRWMMHELVTFTQHLYLQIPSLLGSG